MTRRPSAGDPLRIEASAWGDMLDIRASQFKQGPENPISDLRLWQLRLWGRNDSGADVEPWQPLIGTKPTKSPSTEKLALHDQPAIAMVAPVWPTKVERVVVPQQPIAAGQCGIVAVAGLTLCKCSGGAETDHFAIIDPLDVKQLKSCRSGTEQVLPYGGGGFELIRLGVGQNEYQYTLITAFAGGSATATIRDVEGASIGEITLHDPKGLMTDQEIGNEGLAYFANDKWYAYQATCPSAT